MSATLNSYDYSTLASSSHIQNIRYNTFHVGDVQRRCMTVTLMTFAQLFSLLMLADKHSAASLLATYGTNKFLVTSQNSCTGRITKCCVIVTNPNIRKNPVHCLHHLPIVNVLNTVPTTAKSSIVPRWSKNSLLGMKYPASRMIGGSMYKKKVSGVSGCTWTLWVLSSNAPMSTPTKISRQDSGNILDSFGAMWKPETKS